MSKESFYKLLVRELKDLYSAENQIVEALPEMIEAANSPDLRTGLSQHLEETRHHVKRLEEIFAILNISYRGESCPAMEGLIREGREIIGNREFTSYVKDAAIISAAQRIEHYEIAVYGTAKTFAKELDLDDIAELLKKTLAEEAHCDNKLTDIAEGGLFTSGVNQKAMAEI